jgi:hypothetical protein
MTGAEVTVVEEAGGTAVDGEGEADAGAAAGTAETTTDTAAGGDINTRYDESDASFGMVERGVKHIV